MPYPIKEGEGGHSFSYKHSANRHEITVTANEDLTLPDLMEVIEGYLIACGFAKSTIDDYFEGAL